MKYYSIVKKSNKTQINKRIVLKGGFSFKQKIGITLYENNLVRYILSKKMDKAIYKLISAYVATENDDDDDSERQALLPKLELLRKTLIDNYARYFSEYEIESYLMKIDHLTDRIQSKLHKKSKRR